MTEDFKKWLCDKADFLAVNSACKGDGIIITPIILIKAMWQINREFRKTCEGFFINIKHDSIFINLKPNSFMYYEDYNSEQEALEKALEYVYEQETK